MHTIEAVFLAPLSIIITVLILFAGIILYDRTAVDQALEAALIRGGERSEMKNDELLHYVEDEFIRLLSGRLIAANGRLSVTISYDNISARYSGNVDLPALSAFASLSSALSTDISSYSKIPRLRRSKIRRAVSALAGTQDQ